MPELKLYKSPLLLEDFPMVYETINGKTMEINPRTLLQLMPNDRKMQENYGLFRKRVIEAMGNSFLPVYRMADGEFNYCLMNFSLIKEIKRFLTRKKNYISTCWDENYSFYRTILHRRSFIHKLKQLSKNGLIALHFLEEENDTGYSKYISPMLRWFFKHQIVLNDNNFTSFYFIYAIFSDTRRSEILEGKNLLVITSNISSRFDAIKKHLEAENVKSVQFIEIAADNSMSARIDLREIKEPVDLVVVGGGIGSINILDQLRSLSTVCIDAGIILNIMADQTQKLSRMFLCNGLEAKALFMKKDLPG